MECALIECGLSCRFVECRQIMYIIEEKAGGDRRVCKNDGGIWI